MPYVTRGKMKWTPEMEAKLWGLFQYGLPAREVAAQMGISVSAADARYRKLKKEKEQTDV